MRRRGRKPKQIYAYIDSQNLNVTTQKDGWKMNWAKFRQWLTDEYGVTKAYMFIGYVPEFEPMYEQLHQQGYSIVLKPTFDMTRPQQDEDTKEMKPGEPEPEKRPIKGNIDAELVLWAMKDFKDYDKAIVVSGDGDFYCLVEYLDEQKKLLKLLAPTRKYSSLYNRYEQYVERLDHHRRELEYRDKRRQK